MRSMTWLRNISPSRPCSRCCHSSSEGIVIRVVKKSRREVLRSFTGLQHTPLKNTKESCREKHDTNISHCPAASRKRESLHSSNGRRKRDTSPSISHLLPAHAATTLRWGCSYLSE